MKENSNHGSVEIIEGKPAICDETEDDDDIYADEEDDEEDDISSDNDSEDEMIDDDDHYCPACGSSLLWAVL